MEGREMLTVGDVARELGRSTGTVRDYHRIEGLPFVRIGRMGRLFVSRPDFEEWRGRPAIRAMLADGDLIKAGRRAGASTA